MAIQEFTPEELATEEWRPVANFEDIYSISSLGRFRRDTQVRSHIPRLLSPPIYSDGYVMCALYRNKVSIRRPLHRVVAQAFLGERPTGYQVNHKDGHRANNRRANLEYVTPSENKLHSVWVLGRRHAKKLTKEQVLTMRSLYDSKQCGPTAISRLFRISLSAVKLIVKRKSWQHI